MSLGRHRSKNKQTNKQKNKQTGDVDTLFGFNVKGTQANTRRGRGTGVSNFQ